jgi:hypothetical protein
MKKKTVEKGCKYTAIETKKLFSRRSLLILPASTGVLYCWQFSSSP